MARDQLLRPSHEVQGKTEQQQNLRFVFMQHSMEEERVREFKKKQNIVSNS